MHTIRTFIATEVPSFAVDAIAALQDRLQSLQLQASWVRPSNIHLTLKFLGNIDPQRVPEIRETLTTVTQSTFPFQISLEGMGVFPNWKRPRVVWVGIQEPGKDLSTLHSRIDDALGALGFEKETRVFSPHLTLGRIKSARGSKQLKQEMEAFSPFTSDAFEVNAVTLFQSELTSAGSIYTALAKESFGNKPGNPS